MITTVYEHLPELRPVPEGGENLAGKESDRVHLSYSEISDLLACGQKYFYKREQRIEPISKSPALQMGKAFQKGIEAGDPDVAYLTAMNDPAPVMSHEQHEKRLVQATVAKAACRLYLDLYGTPEGAINEFEYRVRLRNPWTGRYSNTFDLLGFADQLHRDDDGLVLVENKLLSRLDDATIKRLPLDRQVALAAYGIWRATGEQVRKVRYRITRKPAIKQRKNETVTEFCQRLEEDYRARPEFYAVEQTWYRSSHDLVRIEAELWEWARQIREARRQRLFPRNTSHCTDFGGCEFLPLCVGDQDAPHLYQPKESRTEGVNR